ncbi:MAG: type VI secretion system protein TssA [Planctomycetota bacterium]|nr:type VI secretion system protein TssA [Planctomycetota bacterium]
MILDLDQLLQDISPDSPCGEDLEYDTEMLELETEFNGQPAQQMGDSISEAVEPNWETVKDLSLSLLPRTRDLRVQLKLVVALTEVDSLPGLCDGLTLIQRTLSEYWESAYPQLDPEDDNDPLERVNILAGMNIPPSTLGDPVQFRQHVQHAKLTDSRAFGRVGYRDILNSKSGEAPSDDGSEGQHFSASDIDGAFQDSDLDFLVANHEAVVGALEAVQAIDTTLTDLVGSGSATSFDGIVDDLHAIESELADRLRQRGHGVESPESDDDDDYGSSDGGGGGASLSGEVSTPRDAEMALEKVIRYYEAREPSSPVPMLVKVAQSMISKSFLEISSVLPPDTVELINRICSGGGGDSSDDDSDDY